MSALPQPGTIPTIKFMPFIARIVRITSFRKNPLAAKLPAPRMPYAKNAAPFTACRRTPPRHPPWTFYSLAMHVRRCVDCNEIAHSGFHTGGEATCNEKIVCTLCGHTYGEVSNTHVHGEWAPVGGGLHESGCSQCQETGTINCTLWGFLKDGQETRTEIPCTPENGTLTFTIRTEGLFLLVPAA